MTNSWPTVKLGELLQRSLETVEPVADIEYREITVRLWGKGVVERGRIRGSALSGRRFVARVGQFIASRIDARNGAMGLVPSMLDGALVTNDFLLFVLNEQRVLPTYLAWLSRTRNFVELCLRSSEGTTNRVRLKEDRFLALEISLPPLAEQRRVMARIEELAAQIHEARTLRYQAAEEAEALMTVGISARFDKVGVRFPLGKTGACRLVCGQHLKPEEQAESGTPYMTGPADFGDRIAAPSRFARIARAKAEPGDVLLTVKGAGVGKVNLAPPTTCAIGRQLYAMRPQSESLDQTFLFYALQDGLRHFRDSITVTTVPGIGRKEVAALQIPFPPLAEQRRIVAELDALQTEVDALRRLQTESTAELDALLPSILDKAFRGEL